MQSALRAAGLPARVVRPLILLLLVGQFAWAYMAAGQGAGRGPEPGGLPEEEGAASAAAFLAKQGANSGTGSLLSLSGQSVRPENKQGGSSAPSSAESSAAWYWPAAPTAFPGSLAPEIDLSAGSERSPAAGSVTRKNSERDGEEEALKSSPVLEGAGVLDASPIRRLVIPALELDAEVVEAPFVERTWDISELGGKIAWLAGTAWPSMEGNTALAGHITARGIGEGPFRYLHRLKPGDLVSVFTEEYEYIYRVREQVVVKIEDIQVLAPTSDPQLTLLTCTNWDEDLLQYRNRRAVFADLVRVVRVLDSS